jgi:hypothetical protein
MPYSAEQLRKIHTFKDLLHYLEEKLDWPLHEYQFDELTFEYQPEELGLKEEESAKVRSIHQLRPLQHGQPWGIFFVEFENKKLPVVVLRRILSHLVIKKRASANKAGEAAWHSEDLMFITTFGEDDSIQREIAFAHFHQSAGDLPTLHVLGWDGGDTPLKLAHLDSVLQQHLRWPENTADHRAWREQWASPFQYRIGYIISTASALAEALASLARGINNKAIRMLAAESENGPLRKLYKSFQTALIHDLTEESFADTYAQTITYGLLTAAISRTEWSEGRHGTFIIAENVADMVPITNPFLKEMLQYFLKVGGRKGGIDFDELGIQDVVELLRGDETHLPAILRDFGNRTPGEDPVIHFYEHFLSAYNKKLKIQRGVFYTPQPVVSYIIRGVHELLQTEFGLEDGLASIVTWGEVIKRHPDMKLPILTPKNPSKPNSKDILISPESPFVIILDIATGTGTFLVEIIDVIYKTMKAKWQKQGKREHDIVTLWNGYVPKHLLPRLYGYELMMAPYAIAHMKIGLKLSETGYKFESNERVRVYLTNTLEAASDKQQKLVGILPALAHEAQAVNEVKRNVRYTVVVGNPPYSIASYNKSDFIEGIMDLYKVDVKDEKNIQLLSDDYAKFIRFCHWKIEQVGNGVMGFITKNTYLNTSAFKGLRRQLLQSFGELYVYDLHGKLYEKTPNGGNDQNIFDIRVGTAILLGSKKEKKNSKDLAKLYYSELYGDRNNKYDYLEKQNISNTQFEKLNIEPTYFFFEKKNFNEAELYSSFWKIDEIFNLNNTGVETGRDHFILADTKKELENRLRLFINSNLPLDRLRIAFDLSDQPNFKLEKVKLNFKKYEDDKVEKYYHKPFYFRNIYYDHPFLRRHSGIVMQHFKTKDNNLALVLKKRSTESIYSHCFCSNSIVDRNFLGGQSYVFPLWIYEGEKGLFGASKKSNIKTEVEKTIEKQFKK